MLDIPAAAAAVLRGSWRPLYAVDAFYDGDLAAEGLRVLSASFTFDSTRAIHAAGTVVSASTDSSLVPASYAAPLACYGSELHARIGVPIPGQDTWWASLGWYRIDDYDCQEWWAPYWTGRSDSPGGLYPGDDVLPGEDVYPAGRTTHPDPGVATWACRGTQITNNLSDRFANVDDDKFDVPEQPTALGSVLAEITRLAGVDATVGDLTAVTDKAVPATVMYSDSRSQAVQDLAAVLGMTARMDRDGALTLVPAVLAAGAPAWTVTVNDGDVAQLQAWARKGDRSGLFNQWVSSGSASDGAPTQGVATTLSGPLRYGGPFGRVPTARTSPLLTSNIAAQADADAASGDTGGAQVVQIPLAVPLNPALEVGDTITAVLPNGTLTGPVTSLAIAFGQMSMQAVVVVSRDQLWGIA